jgi:ATP-binding cassette subfamily B protein
MRDAFRAAWPYLKRYRRGLALGFGALILRDLAGAALPLAVRAGIDSIPAAQPLRSLYIWCAAVVALSITKGFFMYWMRVILVGISRDVEYDIRNDLFRHLLGLDHGFFARFRTGDIMARATNDLNAVRMMLGPAVMYWAETTLTFLLALGILFSTDWRLTLWALAPAPLVSVVVMVMGRRIHDRFESIQRLFSDLSSRVEESISGVRVVRAYVQEEHELRRFGHLNRRFVRENLRLATLSGLFMPLLQFLVGLTFMLVLWVGGMRLMQGRLTLGSFVMFNTYMGMLIWPMIAFGWVVNLMERGAASMRRLREMLDERPSIAAPASPAQLADGPQDIEFDNVTLEIEGRAALSGVSLRIPAGSTVAIVGRTGSGKTTLINLIARMREATGGTVRLGGIDVRELDPEALRRRIGCVPQETFLFSATVEENIAFGVPDASLDEVRRAAEMAGLGSDIEGFSDGYKTVVGERGVTLSGGQKQRTAIARALLRGPEILILDDALSAVDTLTEERILTNLGQFMHQRTTILISHRVSTVRASDRIFVLDGGRVVEQGTHDELIAAAGYYADLDQKQQLEEELESI